jgi:hypothetical protein
MWTGMGPVTGADMAAYAKAVGKPAADADMDGAITGADAVRFLESFAGAWSGE